MVEFYSLMQPLMQCSNAKVDDKKEKLKLKPMQSLLLAIIIHVLIHNYFGHTPREILRYVYFFIKQETGRVYGTLKSLKCKTSPIASGGLEVSLLLKRDCQEKWATDAMEELVDNFYSYGFTGI